MDLFKAKHPEENKDEEYFGMFPKDNIEERLKNSYGRKLFSHLRVGKKALYYDVELNKWKDIANAYDRWHPVFISKEGMEYLKEKHAPKKKNKDFDFTVEESDSSYDASKVGVFKDDGEAEKPKKERIVRKIVTKVKKKKSKK